MGNVKLLKLAGLNQSDLHCCDAYEQLELSTASSRKYELNPLPSVT
jgi:hypothetical protein